MPFKDIKINELVRTSPISPSHPPEVGILVRPLTPGNNMRMSLPAGRAAANSVPRSWRMGRGCGRDVSEDGPKTLRLYQLLWPAMSIPNYTTMY